MRVSLRGTYSSSSKTAHLAGIRRRVRFVITAVFAWTAVAQAATVRAAPTQAEQYSAIEEALARLREGSIPTSDLDERLGELRRSRGGPCRLDTQCARLWQEITERARRGSLLSEVHVETTKGSGATIRYQTIAERLTPKGDVHEMNDVSPVTERLPIGAYYIWSVRGEVASSPVDRVVEFKKAKENVTLVEK